MDAGEIAGLIAAGAFLMLVIVLAVPILKLGRTVDAATRAINDMNDRSGPLLADVNDTVKNVNVALGQVQVSLDGVNVQLAKVDTITEHAAHVTANVANLSTVVAAAAANPLVKVASFGYGLRKTIASRRRADEEHEIRQTMKQRRKAARSK
ncbi:DUF948 domain-containing protein [Actinoplanes sp. TBRC 11911]|uniref:DUF948 domain-containing protein n=1 Tax=Actinoplanes sp. TBRC 11911 TaxID=2729386 RepID=UPI00145CC9A6|nr:DUF948 domain-containing protein [Actinoplanes sp. TBRC 11911]NMO56293.1 DUF948 domain-containing protein [Actinoplanes sp. TBRC 11911]